MRPGKAASKLLDVDLVDEAVVYGSLNFEVVALNGRNIDKVRISQSTVSDALASAL